MKMENPYQTPIEKPLERQRKRSWLAGVRRFLFAYPILSTGLMYACWGLSAMMLGRVPVPYRDYPDSLLTGMLGSVTAIMYLASPIIFPVGAILAISDPVAFSTWDRAPILRRGLSFLLYTILWAIAGAISYYDPWRVVDWFFD